MIRLAPIYLAFILAAPLAHAQEAAVDPHSGHGASMTSGEVSEATAAFIAASDAMHSAMDIPYTGNADVDFIAGMIPHHQGAVDAARIVLEHGTDSEVRAFAEAIIAAQQAEIDWMTAWLAANAPE